VLNTTKAKAMAAFLSGEMMDTVQMNPAGAYGALTVGLSVIFALILPTFMLLTLLPVLERFFSRKERQRLFRSWAGSASMWIKARTLEHHSKLILTPVRTKGGVTIWGNTTHAADDDSNATHTHGELIAFRHSQPFSIASESSDTGNMTAEEAGNWILSHTPSSFQVRKVSMLVFWIVVDQMEQKMIATNYSFGIERDDEALMRNNLDHTKWTNPLEVRCVLTGSFTAGLSHGFLHRLPNAPSMKFYCVYGHGKETERSYW
jgi:phospholipid:diacylglycerol acyltransferase